MGGFTPHNALDFTSVNLSPYLKMLLKILNIKDSISIYLKGFKFTCGVNISI